jgi:hypothetical protein
MSRVPATAPSSPIPMPASDRRTPSPTQNWGQSTLFRTHVMREKKCTLTPVFPRTASGVERCEVWFEVSVDPLAIRGLSNTDRSWHLATPWARTLSANVSVHRTIPMQTTNTMMPLSAIPAAICIRFRRRPSGDIRRYASRTLSVLPRCHQYGDSRSSAEQWRFTSSTIRLM